MKKKEKYKLPKVEKMKRTNTRPFVDYQISLCEDLEYSNKYKIVLEQNLIIRTEEEMDKNR